MDFAEQLKSSVDIVRTIGEYIPLKQVRGSPRYLGLCPFHVEKTPSFSVHGGLQIYHCFGCNVGGDVFRFVMEFEHISFYEALKTLAERNGIDMPRRDYQDPEAKARGILLDMHALAAELFQENLRGPGGQEARRYLKERGISEAAASEFALGLSDSGGQQLYRRLEGRFGSELLEQSGLVLKRQEGTGYFDRFRGRLMFPIHNESGKVIAFGGRALRSGDEPKYLNSADSAIYHKNRVLYNLHRAKNEMRKSGTAVLVEGYMDVIGVYAAGVREVVASCGTALTPEQARALKRHVPRLTVNFDPDEAGENATERKAPLLLAEGLHVRVLKLDGGLDPDEYVKQKGAEVYRDKLAKAPSYFYWLADRCRAKFDMRSVEGRLEAFKEVAPAIAKISDRLERFAVANDIGSYLGVDPKLIRQQFEGGARPPKTPADRAPAIPAVERLLLNALLVSEMARAEVLPLCRELKVVERFRTRSIFEALLSACDGSEFQFANLEGRLSEADRNLLSFLVFADEELEEGPAVEQALACLETLKRQDPQAEIAALRARIQKAEREGNWDVAMLLMTELDSRLRAE